MKGMIDSGGYLRIWRLSDNPEKRAGRTACPFGLQAMKSCGDWCPLFGQPEFGQQGQTTLALCHKTLVFAEFFDEREPK